MTGKKILDAKAVAKKPSKDAKTVAKKPLKDAKTVAKKLKTQISGGGMCSGFLCFMNRKENENIHQPVPLPEPLPVPLPVPQPIAENLRKTSLDERVSTMAKISKVETCKDIVKDETVLSECNSNVNPYPFITKRKVEDKPIFTTNIEIDNAIYEIVIKSMEYDVDNLLEKNIMIAIRDQIIAKRKSKHFLLIYFYSLCGKKLELRTYNEPAINSFRELLLINYENSTDIDDTLFNNLLIQSLLSIGSFHNLTGYVHMDTHTNNFLYANNSEHSEHNIRYYMYKFGDETYYLKSCKYNMMIYDFGYSNKIKIPVDKIKKFELFYNIEEEENRVYYTRIFIVLKKLYNIKPEEIDSILGRKPEPYERDYLNEIMKIYIQIDKAVNYYRLKILIDDYCIFLKDLGVFFEEDKKDKRRLDTINTIMGQIDKLKETYNRLHSYDITDEEFYGYAKDIFNNVLGICITHFSKSNIFLKSAPKQSNILNLTTPYQLYQQEKITVEEPLI